MLWNVADDSRRTCTRIIKPRPLPGAGIDVQSLLDSATFTDDTWLCSLCPVTFRTKRQFRTHIFAEHVPVPVGCCCWLLIFVIMLSLSYEFLKMASTVSVTGDDYLYVCENKITKSILHRSITGFTEPNADGQRTAWNPDWQRRTRGGGVNESGSYPKTPPRGKSTSGVGHLVGWWMDVSRRRL